MNSFVLSGSTHQQNDATVVNSTRTLSNLLAANPSGTLPLGNMNQNDVHLVNVSPK